MASVAAVATVTAVVYALRSSFPVLSLGVLYLFAVLPIAIVWGRAFSIPVAVASMLAFNFFFLAPFHTFTLLDQRDWLALAVYLVTAFVVSDLASRARRRAADAEQREREEALLADVAIALLQGGRIEMQLDRIADAAAAVLGASNARIELGGETRRGDGGSHIELRAGERLVATLHVDEATEIEPVVRERFFPALASLLAIAQDREELAHEALAAERLRMSDAVKTTILRAVSHDLRSPLTAIRVAAESVASPSLRLSDVDRARQLDTVRRESARLDRLVANLLDLSRLEAGSATAQRELVSVDELISQALAAIDGDERIRVTLPPVPPVIEVDPIQVERVLANVVENALRYSPAESEVLVGVQATDDEAVIRIADRGPGIPASEHDRVFEPFHQLASADGRRGTGLGLAIARGFAQANGGRVWAESDNGRGTTVAAAFPLAQVVPADR